MVNAIEAMSIELTQESFDTKRDVGEFAPTVGISVTGAKEGESVQVMIAGTSIMPIDETAWQLHFGDYINHALHLGYQIPKKLILHSGQMFWKDGKAEEVRLSGYIVLGEVDSEGKTEAVGWATPNPPKFTRGPQGELVLAPEDLGRTHMSALVAENEGAPGKSFLVITLDLTENKRLSDAASAKNKGAVVRFPSNESLTLLPNLGADRDLHRSLMVYPREWETNQSLANCYHDGKDGHTVIYQPSEVETLLQDGPQLALEALEKRFGTLKNETIADVIDILFHHWHRHKDTTANVTNATLITAAKLCEYRGVLPEGDNLELHWHALRDAFSMTLRERSGDIDAKVFFSESKGAKRGSGAIYGYSPGFFLQYALRGEALYFAPFMQKIWELDPKKNNEAKRLARYLRGDWRLNTEKYLEAESGNARPARYHSWTFLLKESGINVEFHRNSKNPGRLVEVMEKAVETLYQMEVLEETGFAIYHPDDRKKAENLPRKGRLNAWLGLRVCLAPAADVREALLETDTKRRAGRARDAAALSSARAKKALKAEQKAKEKS